MTIINREKIWGIKYLSYLSLSSLKKRIVVFKEKASAMEVDLFIHEKLLKKP